jgi:hypothetical protein
VKGGGEGRKEGRKGGGGAGAGARAVRFGAETPAPSPGPGCCNSSPAAARRPRPCSAVGRQEPRRPEIAGYPLPGRAGIEIKASRIKRSPLARPPSPHLQLSSRRTPIHPPTLTWSWRPAPAWREDPRPARGEGWVGGEGESHARPAGARGGRSSLNWGREIQSVSCPLARDPQAV